MSEIHANIAVEPVDLVITAENTEINFTPDPIQLNIYTAGAGAGGAGGNIGELQFNSNGGFGGAANTLVTANGNVEFTNISNLKIAGGNTGYYLQTDGSGNITWAPGTGNVTGNATSAGANNQIQLSDGSGNFKVGAGFSFDPSSNILAVPGNVNATNFVGKLANGTSNIAIASGSNINLTVNGNVSAIVSDNRVTTPALTVNSGNIGLGANAGANSQSTYGIAIGDTAGYDLQGANGIAIGINAGNLNQGVDSIAIGTNAGAANSSGNGQGNGAVAIGRHAGANNQGAYSVAIGYGAGNSQQPQNSIVINATGANFTGAQQNALYAKPVRQANSGNVLYYDVSTGEISYDIKPAANNINNGTSNVSIDSANGNVTTSVNGTSNVWVVSQNQGNLTGNLIVSGSANIGGNLTAGNIIANFTGTLSNGTSNVSIPTANGNVNTSVGGVSNVLVVTTTGANIAGTLNATGNIIGNGILTVTGNITGENLIANTRLITANANIANTLYVGTQANIANLTITSGFGIALGNAASAVANGVALGYNADAKIANSTAIGYTAQANGRGTSVGFNSGTLSGSSGSAVDQTFIGAHSGSLGNTTSPDGQTSVGAWAGYRADGDFTVAVGAYAGQGVYGNGTATIGQADRSIAIGYTAGRTNQQAGAIALGYNSASNNQGTYSIAIGHNAGNAQANNSITIDATNSSLSANIANALFVKPIRDVTGQPGFTVALYYNPTTGEVGYK